MTTTMTQKKPILDVERIRQDFPILHQTVNNYPLVYLDNGATTQKPNAVIDAMTEFYRKDYGTVRRGVYELSVRATQQFEAVRQKTAQFLNAKSENEIIFTRGTTEALNLIAHSFARPLLNAGDCMLISGTAHHANIVPWQQVCAEKQTTWHVIPVIDNGELDQEAYLKLLELNPKLIALDHVSNALGTIHPVKQMIELAHAKGIPVILDGAQGAPHMPVDVQDLDCDFYAFSGHKIYGPSGIGVLYGKYQILEQMPPYQTGGDMIDTVTFEKTTFAKPPRRFEAGTPAMAEVIGLGAALDYVNALGMDKIHGYETQLLNYATELLLTIPDLTILGTSKDKASLVSIVFSNVHPHDIGTLLDEKGIAIRAGHHCAQPLMKRFKVPATTRASFGIYNTYAEIDALVAALKEIHTLFS